MDMLDENHTTEADMKKFRDVKLRELIIKRQHNCKTTGFWYANSIKYNFLLLAHEYLPIFEKPKTHVSLGAKERGISYGFIIPASEKLPLKRKLNELETTTVWIFPEKDFEECLNKNVIDRYSNRKDYSTITFVSHSQNEVKFTERNIQKRKKLLFIKSPFLSNSPSRSNIMQYLKETKEIVNRYLSNISKDGFLVIQTQDLRIDEYVEPLAKRLIDMLILDNLWLKEVVVVTKERQNLHIDKSDGTLNITHRYLLVYEKKVPDPTFLRPLHFTI